MRSELLLFRESKDNGGRTLLSLAAKKGISDSQNDSQNASNGNKEEETQNAADLPQPDLLKRT